MSMTPGYFHRKQKNDETRGTPWLLGYSFPHLLIANTWQLEVLVTALPLVSVRLYIHRTSKTIKIQILDIQFQWHYLLCNNSTPFLLHKLP